MAEKILLESLLDKVPDSQVVSLDSKGPEEILNNRREADPLPKGSFQKLPETMELMVKRLDDNPAILSKIQNLLKEVLIRLGKEAGNMEDLFSNAIPFPKNIDKELMRLLGVTQDELRKAGDKIGFSVLNRMLTEPYYIVLSFLYWYGTLDKHQKGPEGNQFLRHSCLILMLVRLYRGRIARFFRQGTDDTTVKYVMEKKLKKNNLAVTHPNTFNAIYRIWAPRLDTKYWEIVREHPAHDRRGMVSILKAAHTRLHQAYFGLAKHYYEAFNAGIKTGNYRDEEFEEKQKLSLVEKLVDKIYTNIIYMSTPIPNADKIHLRDTLRLSLETVHRFENFIKDSKNELETQKVIELMVSASEATSESDLANIKVVELAEKFAASRSKGQNQELKDTIDQIIRLIFGNNITSASPSQQLKIRKAFILLFTLKIKQPFKKLDSYFEKKIIF